jgi:hypothetical protein
VATVDEDHVVETESDHDEKEGDGFLGPMFNFMKQF